MKAYELNNRKIVEIDAAGDGLWSFVVRERPRGQRPARLTRDDVKSWPTLAKGTCAGGSARSAAEAVGRAFAPKKVLRPVTSLV